MALNSKSLFLYGYTVTESNCNIDFQNVASGTVLTATLALGTYSLTSLLVQLSTAMEAVDANNTYTWTADRTVMGGLQNRVTVTTSGSYLKILFLTGPNAGTSVISLIGFNQADYSGLLTYTGSITTGTALVTSFIGYNYQDPTNQAKVFGVRNISASGLKEAVTFNIQQFIDVEYKYEPAANLPAWLAFMTWAIQQSPFDITPQIFSPSTVYQVTLEKTDYESQGLGFRMKEMLPNFPNLYQTGPLNFRVVLDYYSTEYIT